LAHWIGVPGVDPLGTVEVSSSGESFSVGKDGASIEQTSSGGSVDHSVTG
jgi:hypothetical protein